VAALLAPGLAQAKWMKAETERFVVYSNGDERTLREYAVKLEDFETVLRMFFALKPEGAPPRKFEIYLVSDTAELRRVSPWAPETLAGFYTASPSAIFAVAIRARGDGDKDDTIFHEYAHHFMMQYLAGSYPGWLVEGFAEYYMTARLKPTSFEIGTFNSGRAYTLLSGSWTPTDVVLTRRTSDLRRDQVLGYYAQSWLMTHYMLADPARRQQLFAYVRLVAQGKESAAAWTEATGESIEAFDAKLKVYMRKGIPSVRFKRTAYTPAPVTITVLPPSADDLLLESLRATLGGFRKPELPEAGGKDEEGPKAGGRRAGSEADPAAYEKERLAFIDRVRTRAAKYPTDGLAQRTLAQVELEGGDKATGVAILDRLIAADDKDAEALRLKATVLLNDA
jgi:AcrR family transcriptional regulator